MRFFYSFLSCLFFLTHTTTYAIEKQTDLDFEQALYEHLQNHYLQAITLSEVLREKSDHINIKQQVLLSSSYYKYRLPQTALDLLNNGLNIKVIKADEDILLFQIAKNQYYNKEIEAALNTFNKIIEPINPTIEAELNYLKSDIYIQKNELEIANKIALELQGNNEFFPFIAHNLATAYLNNKQLEDAQFWTNALNDEQYQGHQHLKDSLLLSSGIYHLRQKNYTNAIDTILLIKKESTFAPKGLLALGQSLVLDKNISEAKRFYNYLSNYPQQNIYYQESLLYLAESDKGNAAKQLFKHAISNYNELLDQVNSLVNNDMAEGISSCLVKNIDNPICDNVHLWIESFEETEIFKSHLTQNKQLQTIQHTLSEWSKKLEAYQFILKQRKDDFDNKLPAINSQLNPAQIAKLKKYYDAFKTQAEALKKTTTEFGLINEDESDQIDDINYVDVSVKRLNILEKSDKDAIKALQTRAQFTKGILMWELVQQKPIRLRQVTKNLTELNQLLKTSSEGMKKLQQFNQSGDKRLTHLSLTLKRAKITLNQLQDNVGQLIFKNRQQLTSITQTYLMQRRATLIHLNSRSKYLLTQLQDIQ